MRMQPARTLTITVALLASAGITGSATAATLSPASTDRVAAQSANGHAAVAACEQWRSTTMASCAVLTIHPRADTPTGYGPADLQSAYGLTALNAGARQTVAVVTAYDDPTAEADLATYRSTYDLAPCTTADSCFQKINQTGGSQPPPPNGQAWADVTAADLDVISAVCPNCRLLLIEATSNQITDMGAAVNQAVTSGANVIDVGWGVAESAAETGYDSSYFEHKGVTIVAAAPAAASGDGSGMTAYPAASPYVTAVGGTTLTAGTSTRGWTETAWPQGGSGCSPYEANPSWQPASICGGKRALNDVSADAGSPVASYNSYDNSGWNGAEGTGVAAAIIAGIYGLAGPDGSSDYPAAYPYQHPGGSYTTPRNAYAYSEGLNDITSGNNGTCATTYMCQAGKGYDGPTGLGSPESSLSFTATGITSGSVRSQGAYDMCMDNTNNKPANGNNIQIYQCQFADASQNWTLEANGTLQIQGKCADIANYGTTPGSLIQLYTCESLPGATNQQWQARANGQIVNPASGLCLDNPGGTQNTIQLQIDDCSAGNPAQTWLPPYIVPTSTGDISETANVNICINDANGAQKDGAIIRAYPCLPSDNSEIWHVEPGGDIGLSENTGYCIDIQNSGTAPGSVLQLYTCNGGASQQWVAQSDGSLLNPASGLCLEDPGNGGSGTQLDINTCPSASDFADMQWMLPSL
jgi:Ricin-type beta-trefoil lectin domain